MYHDLEQVLKVYAPHILKEIELLESLQSIEAEIRARYKNLLDSRQAVSGVLNYAQHPNVLQALLNWAEQTRYRLTSTQNRFAAMETGKFLHKKTPFKLITAFLCFFQGISIAEIFGVEVQNPDPDSYLLLGIAAIAALGLTFGTKEALIRLVQASYSPDRKKPWWSYIVSGDVVVSLSIVIVVAEAAFAAPGLLSLFPPRLAAELTFQVGAYIAASLGAFVNVLLAWAIGIERVNQAKTLGLIEANSTTVSKASEYLQVDPFTLRVLRRSHDKEVLFNQRALKRAEKNTRIVHRRVTRELRMLMRRKDVQDFISTGSVYTLNGHERVNV